MSGCLESYSVFGTNTLPNKQVFLVLFLIIFEYIALIIVCDCHTAMRYYSLGNNKGKQIM